MTDTPDRVIDATLDPRLKEHQRLIVDLLDLALNGTEHECNVAFVLLTVFRPSNEEEANSSCVSAGIGREGMIKLFKDWMALLEAAPETEERA